MPQRHNLSFSLRNVDWRLVMVIKEVSPLGAPFEIERIWIEDGRLFYTRQGDSLVATGPSKPGVKALIVALQEILRALK
jgi:hypothetical protein